ncbi:MAG: ANTAR domain-containing protein [Kibdelosporangium sp.]
MTVDQQRHPRLWRLVTARVGQHRRPSGWAGVVCDVVVQEVGVDAAAITVHAAARTQELVAASDEWAQRLEELQFTVGEGPGQEAFTSGGPVLMADLDVAAGRWPGFSAAAAGTGLAAMFSFPIQSGPVRLGTLNLYRHLRGVLAPPELADAAALADLATTALLTDSRPVPHEAPAAWARADAPGHYDDVNVATGMLAAQLHVSVEDAFLRLRAHAFSHDIPVFEVARAVLQRRLRLDSIPD